MNTEIDVICDHAGPCPPRGRGCRWVQFEREYTTCDCGGWDERWVSRDKDIRLVGRANHRRTCVNHEPSTAGPGISTPAAVGCPSRCGRNDPCPDPWHDQHRSTPVQPAQPGADQ